MLVNTALGGKKGAVASIPRLSVLSFTAKLLYSLQPLLPSMNPKASMAVRARVLSCMMGD